MKEYNLQQFVDVKNNDYEPALSEISEGRNRSHLIWNIFLQFKEFAHRQIAEYYEIMDIKEVAAYSQYPILGHRIRDLLEMLLLHKDKDFRDIFGELDAGIVHSNMMMFDSFHTMMCLRVPDTSYDGKPGGRTLSVLLAKC